MREAAGSFVGSFLLSSKCWHAGVSSHSSFVILKMLEHNAAAIPPLLAAQPEWFLNRKRHRSKGFNASLRRRSCLRPHAPDAALRRYSPIIRLKKQSIGSTPGGVIDPQVQPQGPSALPGSRKQRGAELIRLLIRASPGV